MWRTKIESKIDPALTGDGGLDSTEGKVFLRVCGCMGGRTVCYREGGTRQSARNMDPIGFSSLMRGARPEDQVNFRVRYRIVGYDIG